MTFMMGLLVFYAVKPTPWSGELRYEKEFEVCTTIFEENSNVLYSLTIAVIIICVVLMILDILVITFDAIMMIGPILWEGSNVEPEMQDYPPMLDISACAEDCENEVLKHGLTPVYAGEVHTYINIWWEQ